MKKTENIVGKMMLILSFLISIVSTQNMPFPQQKNYPGCIKPELSQGTMDTQIKAVYDSYKSDYLKSAKNTANGYYIESSNTVGTWDVITVSEAHGWGMVIMTQMAGYDSDAQKYFDGMLAFYKDHLNSQQGTNLMGWQVYGNSSKEIKTSDMSQDQKDQNSNATDGDLDVAYALLLAYKQWGKVSYRNLALAIIQDIKSYNIHPASKAVMLGNWAAHSSNEAHEYTRPSDWMGAHLHTFADVTGDKTYWDGVVSTIYTVYEKFQEKPYAKSGLISDFVYFNGSDVNSAESTFLSSNGEEHPDKYHTNAARVPWHIATDYAMSKNSSAKAMLDKFNGFISSKISFPSDVREGYHLDGEPINNNAGGASYLAPFMAAAIAGSNKSFLTSAWNTLNSMTVNDAYQAAIRLQSMLLVSGNKWTYGDASTGGIEDPFDTMGVIFDDFSDNDLSQAALVTAYGKEKFPLKPWDAGGYWYVYDAGKDGSVKGFDGTVIDTGNAVKMFKSNTMDVEIIKTGTIEVGFPEDKYYDLSSLTGVTVTAKGSGNLRISFVTDDGGTLKTDEFWGGYGANIELADNTKKFQIPGALFVPEVYSKEHTNGWSWATNGRKKVKGLRLSSIDSKNVTIVINAIEFNGSNIKNETFGFTTPVIIDPVDGVNVLTYGNWNFYFDALGSKGTITTEKVNSSSGDSITSLSGKFERAAFSKKDAYDTYVTLVGTFNGDFKNLDTVEITYTSDAPFNFSFPMTGITDNNGAAHRIELLAASTKKTVTKLISDFKQPIWIDAAMKAVMDKSKLTGVSFEIASDEQTALNGILTITSIILKGASIKGEAVPVLSEGENNISKIFIDKVHSNSIVLNFNLVNQAKLIKMTLLTITGRQIAQKSVRGTKGINRLEMNTDNIAPGFYLLGINANGLTQILPVNLVR